MLALTRLFKAQLKDCATPEEVLLFEEKKSTGPDTLKIFRLAYTKPPSHVWNLQATEFFIDAFFSAGQAGWFEANKLNLKLEDVTRETVAHAFRSRFYDFRKACLRKMDPPPEEKVDTEKENDRRYGRRKTVYKDRLAVCYENESLQDFAYVVERLGILGMSEDETDIEATPQRPKSDLRQRNRFRRVELAFRNTEIVQKLHELDHLCREEHPIKKAHPGNPKRERLMEAYRTDTIAHVRGLPANFYDKAWVAALRPVERARLQMTAAWAYEPEPEHPSDE
jgi:hypothetical protein